MLPFVGDIFKLDGVLDEWDAVGPTFHGVGGEWENSVSATSYLGWSDEGLNFAFDVNDDEVEYALSNFDDMNQSDCIEMYIDTRQQRQGIKHHGVMGPPAIGFEKFEVLDKRGEWSKVDSDDPSLLFRGDWSHVDQGVSDDLVKLGLYSKTTDVEASIEYRFEGIKLVYYGRIGPWMGRIRISIDGTEYPVVDQFSFSKKVKGVPLFVSPVLDPGEHTLLIKFAGTNEKGVSVLKIVPKIEDEPSGSAVIVGSYGEEFLETVQVTDREYGYSIEGMIPWAILGDFEPYNHEWLKLGYKIYDKDFSDLRSARFLGHTRIGSRASVPWLASNPERLGIYKIGKRRQDQGQYETRVREFVLDDSVLLKMEILGRLDSFAGQAVEARVFSEGRLVDSSSGVFAESSSSRFSRCVMFSGLDEALLEVGTVDIVFLIKGQEIAEHKVELKALALLAKANALFSSFSGADLPENQKMLVELYIQAIKELARHVVGVPNHELVDYHLLPYYEDDELIIEQIQYFEQRIEELRKPLDESVLIRNHHQVWRSDLDGSVQPFKLKYPKDYREGVRYPLHIKFNYPEKKLFHIVRFLLPYISGDDVGEARSSNGAYFEIEIYGRGSSVALFGDEEFQYIVNEFIDTLPIDENRLVLFGNSLGGAFAYRFGTRYADKVALVDAESPALLHGLPDSWNGRGSISEQKYLKGYFGGADFVENLSNLGVRFVVGENDKSVSFLARRILKRFSKMSDKYQLDVIEGQGHIFNVEAVIPDLNSELASIKRNPFPDRISHSTIDLTYGANGWISVEKQKKSGTLSKVFASKTGDGLLTVRTNNVAQLGINIEKTDPNGLFDGVVINGSKIELGILPGRQYKFEESEFGTWSSVGPENKGKDSIMKSGELFGPIVDIRRKRTLIVYGTMRPETTSVLKRRAYEIADGLDGSREGQASCFRSEIKSDIEVSESDIDEYSLWLLGNERENILTQRVFEMVPVKVAGGVEFFGERFEDEVARLRFVYPNPLNRERYVYIEASNSKFGYDTSGLADSKFDFEIQKIDGLTNRLLYRGLFSPDWELSLEDGLITDLRN